MTGLGSADATRLSGDGFCDYGLARQNLLGGLIIPGGSATKESR